MYIYRVKYANKFNKRDAESHTDDINSAIALINIKLELTKSH